MNPTSYVHCNHIEKGNDFPKDREGDLSNLEPMGKSHVLAVKPIYLLPTLFYLLSFPCLIQLPP